MLKNVTDLTNSDFSKGLTTFSNIFSLSKQQSPNMMDCFLHFDGSVHKRKGSVLQNQVALTSSGTAGFGTDSGGTLPTGIIAFWDLDESSGDRFDTFGGNILESVNSVGKDAGILANAAKFVATDTQYLIINNTSTLATGDVDFSISTWFQVTTLGDYTIISKRDQGTNSTSKLLLHFDGSPGVGTVTDSSLSNHTVTTVSNAIIDQTNAKFGSGAILLLEASGSYLSVGSSSDFNVAGGDMTIDCWINFITLPGAGGASAAFFGMRDTASDEWGVQYDGNTVALNAVSNGTTIISAPVWIIGAVSLGVYKHYALVKQGTSYTFYLDGVKQGATHTDADDIPNVFKDVWIGRRASSTLGPATFDGYIDEYNFTREAKWTSNFTPPSSAYSNPSIGSEYEYSLYTRSSDNNVVFSVSSSGTTSDGTVAATSFGAITTATWYHVVAWHDTGNTLGIAVNLTADTVSYASGVRSGSGPFVIGAISNGAGGFLDGRVDETGFWKKVLTAQERSDLYNSGAANRFSEAFDNYTWGAFDFGASNIRWLVVAAGTGLYASSNLGVNFTVFGTSQTATWNNFERSKNVLVVTTDAYDTPLIWDGSGGTYASILNNSAPTCKYAINHQGFLILLNSNTQKRLFAYEDVNTQLTGDWGDSFELPSSQDDEITGAVILRRNLYVSTRFKIYRLSYVGGNPDWSYTEIKNWGYVPRTIQKISLKDIGEVVVGQDWNRRIRLFDGADDRIISDPVELDNGLCDFAIEKISYAGSGLFNSHAVADNINQIYRLNVVLGGDSTNTTHILNLDGRNLAFYPYQNQPWQTMVIAESDNRQFLLAGNRSSQVYLLNTSNLDQGTTPIDDVFDSPFIYDKSPSEVAKTFKADLYFGPTSSNAVYYFDCTDFSDTFKLREKFNVVDTGGLVQIKKSIDVPTSQNVYQYRITSSMGTSDPWELNRVEIFVNGKGIGENP